MKLRKQIKNRIVAVVALAVVLVCGFSFCTPQVVKASSFLSFDFTNLDSCGNAYYKSDGSLDHYVSQIQFSGDSNPTLLAVYCPYKSNGSFFLRFVAIGKGGLSVPKITTVYDNGETYTRDGSFIGSAASGLDSYSCYSVGGQTGGNGKANFSAYVIPTTPSEWNDYYNEYKKDTDILMQYVNKYLANRDGFTYVSNGTDEYDNIPDGSQNNPYKKDNFGYPQIYNSTYIHNDPNNLETLDKLYSGQDFQWKKKTTTGFDLTNNDYNYTYIECKVKANYQYNDKFSGKGSWHDFASYGEMGNLGKVRAESLSQYYTFQEFQEALPKTSNELPDHKMRAIKSSEVYYFRVVCMKTSSTVVIPDEKDCKYYAGPWRSVTVTKINGKDGTSVVEDGEFDENGEWKKDDDSGDNGKDIDNGSAEGDDLSDASDKAHETINSNANKSTLDLDSAKAFINQVADVPKMIGDIFSFFPDWVKYTVELGFAFIFILIVYKLIRG